MLVRRRKGWEISDAEATPEAVFRARRDVVKGLGFGIALAAASPLAGGIGRARADDDREADPTADLYPVPRNEGFSLDRPLSPEDVATRYNNYYEFGSHKEISKLAQALPLRPWTVTFDGMVEKEQVVDIDDLIRQMPLEERLYRHRCVEAWSIAVPYGGFPLRALLDFARPLGDAKYVVMETFQDKSFAPGQRQFWYPWPYVEGLTIDEAANDLAFIATGYYGKPIPKQNGAPLRLAVPWKYGFKHIKGIVKFTFTDKRPVSFWQEIAGNEYGFWANVNPDVAHPRWSQAREKFFGPDGTERRDTQLYNGYGEFVAGLYKGREKEALFK